MSRKPKFRPRITRIKLNPEQAVLVCDCWDKGSRLFWWEDPYGRDSYNAFLPTACTGKTSKGGWKTSEEVTRRTYYTEGGAQFS